MSRTSERIARATIRTQERNEARPTGRVSRLGLTNSHRVNRTVTINWPILPGSECRAGALGDMEHERACLEQGEIAFLVGRNLTERMQRQMRRFLHRSKRNQANPVGLAHFFKRPANARITRQSPSGDRSKAVMVMVIMRLRLGENHRLAICRWL